MGRSENQLRYFFSNLYDLQVDLPLFLVNKTDLATNTKTGKTQKRLINKWNKT